MIEDLSDDDEDLLDETVDDEDASASASTSTSTGAADSDDDGSDNIGDPSVEINVEELITELEAQGISSKLGTEKDTRHRLEELMERKRARRDLEDFEDYDI